MPDQNESELLLKLKKLIETAYHSVVRHINSTMTYTYFMVGKYIVEDEQQGKERAEYSATTLKLISKELIKEYGKGYSERNLQQMRKFYIVYKYRLDLEPISQTSSAKSNYIINNEVDIVIS